MHARDGRDGGWTATFHQARIEPVVRYHGRREWLNIREASVGWEFSVGGCTLKFFLFYERATCCLVLNSPDRSGVRLLAKEVWADK